MTVREKTLLQIEIVSQRIDWLRSLGDGYSDEIDSIQHAESHDQLEADAAYCGAAPITGTIWK